jgi:hypothetical protein
LLADIQRIFVEIDVLIRDAAVRISRSNGNFFKFRVKSAGFVFEDSKTLILQNLRRLAGVLCKRRAKPALLNRKHADEAGR